MRKKYYIYISTKQKTLAFTAIFLLNAQLLINNFNACMTILKIVISMHDTFTITIITVIVKKNRHDNERNFELRSAQIKIDLENINSISCSARVVLHGILVHVFMM